MPFRGKKIYGQSKVDTCTFCDNRSMQENKQGVLVCKNHVTKLLEEIKCTCGSTLEQKKGKFGTYFNCINCGNISFNKGMEMKSITESAKPKVDIPTYTPPKRSNPTEIEITTDDMEYFS